MQNKDKIAAKTPWLLWQTNDKFLFVCLIDFYCMCILISHSYLQRMSIKDEVMKNEHQADSL